MLKAGKPVADVDHEPTRRAIRACRTERRGALDDEKSIADATTSQHCAARAREQETVRANDRAQTKTLEADAARTDAQASAQAADAARLDARRARKKTQVAVARPGASERPPDLQAKKTDRGLVITLGECCSDRPRGSEPGARRSLEKLSNSCSSTAAQCAIEGFTDSIGTDDYNQGLSERRADAVRDELTGMAFKGSHPDRGLGKTTRSGQRQRRRVGSKSPC